jgi:hypothetical protein
MTRVIASLLVCCTAASAFATTAPDLRSRISIDGKTRDFEGDEWVLDDATPVRERPDDSRWGRDNDIRAVAITWDNYCCYIAVPAVTSSTRLMLFVDTMCGGKAELVTLDYFRRNIELGDLTANFLLSATPAGDGPFAGYIDCTRPFNLIDPSRFESVYLQDGVADGALEVALPWGVLGDFTVESGGVRVPSEDATIALAAVVTGGEGTGAGDAAPDPSVVLENDSTRVAIVDNHIIIPLDADGDGMLDMGVSPRTIASYALSPGEQGSTARQVLALRIPLDEKLYSPLREREARFPVVLDSQEYTEPVIVTARVFASDGHVVRTLFAETPIDFSSGPVWITWNFEDDQGRVVPGGVYVLAVSGGAGAGTPKNTAKAAFAVVR